MFYVHLENYDLTSQSDDLHSFILLATNWSRDRTNRWFGAKNEREEEEKNESSETKGLNYHSQNQLVHRKVRELRTDLYCHEEKELIFRSFHIGITPGFVSFKWII